MLWLRCKRSCRWCKNRRYLSRSRSYAERPSGRFPGRCQSQRGGNRRRGPCPWKPLESRHVYPRPLRSPHREQTSPIEVRNNSEAAAIRGGGGSAPGLWLESTWYPASRCCLSAGLVAQPQSGPSLIKLGATSAGVAPRESGAKERLPLVLLTSLRT